MGPTIQGERPCTCYTPCSGSATCGAPSTSTPGCWAWSSCAPPSGPSRKYTLAFVGFGGGNRNGEAELELTYNHGVSDYDLGSAYGHIAVGVDDVAATCARIRAGGGNITREPGPVKGGATVIAFVEDPDGYKVELIETASREI